MTLHPERILKSHSSSNSNPSIPSCSLCLTVDPFSPGGPGRPISPRSPWIYISTTFSHLSHLVGTCNIYELTRKKQVILPSPLPVPPRPQARWNQPSPEMHRHNVWIDRYLEKQKMEVAVKMCLTLSPMGPTFPVMPGSPCRDKYKVFLVICLQ